LGWIDSGPRAIVPERTPYDIRPVVTEARQRDLKLSYLVAVLERAQPAFSSAEKVAP
jgi:hypothetical protein